MARLLAQADWRYSDQLPTQTDAFRTDPSNLQILDAYCGTGTIGFGNTPLEAQASTLAFTGVGLKYRGWLAETLETINLKPDYR